MADAIDALLGIHGAGIIKGKDFLHQFQLHQILDVHADFRPGKTGMQMQIIEFVLPFCKAGQNRTIHIHIPQFTGNNLHPFFKQSRIRVQNASFDILFQGYLSENRAQ